MSKVENGNTVKVHYTGKFEDGSVFDSSLMTNQPITFQVGTNQVIPGFENAVLGMTVGESKTVTITPEEGYGDRLEQMVHEVPRDIIPTDAQVGSQLVSESEQGTFNVVVKEIKDDVVVLDANHPLAGKTLVFDLELVEIS